MTKDPEILWYSEVYGRAPVVERGDGFEDSRLEQHGDGAFTAWYGREGTIVGVLAHEADEDYERGRSLIAEGAPWR